MWMIILMMAIVGLIAIGVNMLLEHSKRMSADVEIKSITRVDYTELRDKKSLYKELCE